MHQIVFYPVGNGDSSQYILDNGKRILLDFRQHSNAEDSKSPEIDLAKELKKELKEAKKDSFEVVAFTHADEDHIQGFSDFFELDHAAKYQGDERIKIEELWVPAAVLCEKIPNKDQKDEYFVLRAEARHRLKENYGIKIFSKPQEIVDLLKEMELGENSRDHLFCYAGDVVDTFDLKNDGVEFFSHSPYKKHIDDNGGKKEHRNKSALIFNVRLQIGNVVRDVFTVGDSTSDVLADVVNITESKNNQDRLEWNIYNIPHHCSYLALATEGNKGEKKTTPTEEVKKLLRYGRQSAYMICSSRPIHFDDDAYEQIQPPHVQARNTYVDYLNEIKGRKFLVTMEEPNTSKPKPISFQIDENGLSLKSFALASGAGLAAESQPARAGSKCIG